MAVSTTVMFAAGRNAEKYAAAVSISAAEAATDSAVIAATGNLDGTDDLAGSALEVGHLLDDVGCGKSRDVRVLRPASTVGAVTEAAGVHVGFAPNCHHIRHDWMIARVPIRRHEEIAQLAERISPRASRNVSQAAVVDCRL